MFDGKRFFPETGIPMRKIVFMRSPFALAEPVPFTVAILTAKSLRPLIVPLPRSSGRGAAHRRRARRTA